MVQSIGTGAFSRYGDTPTIRGAVYALQKQLGSDVHFGAKSALMLHGFKRNGIRIFKAQAKHFGALA